jgi:hypothetical protein
MSARLCVIDYMGKKPIPNVPAVTKFVREVSGCNCPDEVFRNIEIQRGSSAIKACSADCELRIGGRLLILVTSEPVANLSARLGQVIAEGKTARDEHEFNRFRLVVQTENTAQEREKLLRAFEEVAEKDERTHPHVLGKTEVPNLFA